MLSLAQLVQQYNRNELKKLILEKDYFQSREKTANELNISLYSLRKLCDILGLELSKGRPQKRII